MYLVWLVNLFSTYTRHSHEYQLWSSSGRLPPLFTRGRFHAENGKKTPLSFNFLFRYIGSTLSLINSKFDVYVDHIYPIELEIKDSMDSARSAWYTPKKLAVRVCRKFTTKEMISNFPWWTFHLYVATLQKHLHVDYISLNWYFS